MGLRVATILVGPQTLFRQGLSLLLADTRYKVVKSATSIDELTRSPGPKDGAGLFIVSSDACATVVDVGVPLPELQLLKRQDSDARIILLSGVFDAKQVMAALLAGADGYVMDTITSQALITSLDLVMCGETVVASEFMRELCERARPQPQVTMASPTKELMSSDAPAIPTLRLKCSPEAHKLSGKETAILSRLTQGESNKLIARRVGMAEATVKTHIKGILRKISVKNRTQAALWAVNNLGLALAAPAEFTRTVE